MRGWWLLLAGIGGGGCDAKPCERAMCGGADTSVALVDQAGEPVLTVRGEYRRSGGNDEASARSFTCSRYSAPDPAQLPCSNGVLSVPPPTGADAIDEIRFEVIGEGFSEWQPIALHVAFHSEPDFNGPGCACSWSDATAEPVVVPRDVNVVDTSIICFTAAELPDQWFDTGAGGAGSRECPVARDTSFGVSYCAFELYDTALRDEPGLGEGPCCYSGRLYHCR